MNIVIIGAIMLVLAIAIAIPTIYQIAGARVRWLQNQAWKRTYFDYQKKTWING
jgi:hypothetical protein